MAEADDNAVEWAKCAADPAYACHTYGVIDDAQGLGNSFGVMPFRLWPAQIELLWTLLINRLVLILKSRQLGVSWICCWYVLWLCFWQSGKLALLLSRGQDEADEMLRRVRVLYERLPEWMRRAGPAVIKLNTEEIAWSNGSRVQSLPASPGSGRSYTASVAVMDEAAFMAYATEVYTAMKPTIDGGGQLIVLSTANGRSNLFYELCQRAVAGVGGFVFRFLPWWARPGRDAAWYAATEADAVDSALMRQEYPATPEEAFEATEVNAFLPSISLWDACQEVLPPLGAHEPCILALDAAESNDTFGSLLISRHPTEPRRLAVRYVRAYAPTPGVPLDFDAIEGDVRDLVARYAVRALVYDPFLLGQTVRRLTKPRERDEDPMPIPTPCEKFPQGSMRLESDKELLDMTLRRDIAHDGNPELRAHMANANKKLDSESRKLRIVKREYKLKIDLAVCLSMGAHVAQQMLDATMHLTEGQNYLADWRG